ncbi:MAG: GAF domain-containing protein [Desulfobacterales bacterium]|nr:GAF domain-containing protein [Desulfobacterales bacterium]
MLDNNKVSIKRSVAATLIKKVFGIYFIVTIIITCVQLTFEYFHVKDSIIYDISRMEKSFETGLAEALWDMNIRQLQSIIYGMNELSIVTGIKIDDEAGSEIGAIGVILRGEEQVFISSSDNFTPLKGLFSYSFQIGHPFEDENYHVGTATIYSASKVVIDRIKYGFFLIVINSVIKTAALWLIIIYFTRIIIGKPLSVLTDAAEKTDPNNPDFFNIRYSSEEKRLFMAEDELGVLARSFDKMRNSILERIQNLQILRDLGEDMAASHEFSASFRRLMKTMEEKYTFQKGALFLADENNMFKIESCYPDRDHTVIETESFRVGEGAIGKAIEQQEMIYIPHSYDSTGFAGEKSAFESMLSVPLIDEKGLSGAIVFFSGIEQEFELSDENRVFLDAVARLTLINVKNIQMTVQVTELLNNLEHKVSERTSQLEESLEHLKKTQDQLVQSEKMAALGGLVAGVAHEINTPVGIGVTEASFLQEKTKFFSEAYTSGNLKRSDFEKYIKNAIGASDSILSNLERAAELITSFKQVAVDQSSEERRRFVLKTYISEILLSLHSKYKKTSHTIAVNCPEDLEIDSYPGVFSQVITNFVTNSLIHGFEGIEKGEIVFDISAEGDELLFRYSDNGRGMDDECLRQVFEPFFTTKRTRGGTGLGMHVVYNLVTQRLGGHLKCKSTPGEGTSFLIKMKIET